MTTFASPTAPAGPQVAVPFLDLRAPYLELQGELDAALHRVAESGWYLLGDELLDFERAFCAYTGVAHCAGVANGLDALHLSLRAMGVGAGDEVIVPSNTYIATWLAVTQVGATVVPVEPNARTYNLDPDAVAAAVSSRTRVILPVHLYGQPADMDPLCRTAERHGVHVLEDAAQAHGARYRGRQAGTIGTMSAWSFYPGKNLGAFGDAGGVTTNDATLDAAVRRLRNYGSRQKYVNEVPGYNSRLDDLQAAVLAVKLRHLDVWNARRTRQAARYADALAGTDVVLPYVPEWAEPSWHLYVVRVRNRDAVQRALAAQGIQTLIHYPIPPHHQEAYAPSGFPRDAFPIARAIAAEALSLPIGPHLSDAAQDRVIEALLTRGVL